MTFFQFESDFVQSLRCIPMQVRYKLDSCGIKLKLDHWHRFSAEERMALVDLPCETESGVTAYRAYLENLVIGYTQSPPQNLPVDPHPPWHDRDRVPEVVQAQANQFGVTIDRDRWAAITSLQRFALLKLSRPGHENRNFLSALEEFGLSRGERRPDPKMGDSEH